MPACIRSSILRNCLRSQVLNKSAGFQVNICNLSTGSIARRLNSPQDNQQSGAKLKHSSAVGHFNSTVLTQNLVSSFQQNVNWVNQQYDKAFGIAEIRDIQHKVLEVESEFIDITQKRKTCQEQIETLKDEIKGIRDKLEITPRQSDNYLRLITEEHKLLREQLALDDRLAQLKEREQLFLDRLSRFLRQSHELERLRQERAKYWQIISVMLSLACTVVAMFAQKSRSQKATMKQVSKCEATIADLKEEVSSLRESIKEEFASHKSDMRLEFDHLYLKIQPSLKNNETATQAKSSWFPGLSYMKYIFYWLPSWN